MVEWAGESYSLQWNPGSSFVMKPDNSSAGIQIADIALWLYGQSLKEKKFLETVPSCCCSYWSEVGTISEPSLAWNAN